MKFEFSATVTTRINILNERVQSKEFTEQEIRTWCEQKELIASGSDLAAWELADYGREMYACYLEDELNSPYSYLPDQINRDIKDELELNPWSDNTTIEEVRGGIKACQM